MSEHEHLRFRAAKRVHWTKVEDYLRLGWVGAPDPAHGFPDPNLIYGCWMLWLCECPPPVIKRNSNA